MVTQPGSGKADEQQRDSENRDRASMNDESATSREDHGRERGQFDEERPGRPEHAEEGCVRQMPADLLPP